MQRDVAKGRKCSEHPTLFPKMLLAILILVCGPRYAGAAPTDINSDGRSEVFLAQSSTESTLQFSAYDIITNTTTSIGSLGTLGDHIALGSWTQPGRPQIAVVSKGTDILTWKLLSPESQAVEASFGSPSDTFMSGADLDGDGLLDAVSTSTNSRKRKWNISTSLFNANRSDTSISFGFSNEIPFYIHSQGKDLLALLSIGTRGQTVLRTYDTATGKSRRMRLRRAPSPSAPLPIRFSSSENGIVYAVDSGATTKLSYHSLNTHSVIETGTVPLTGTILVGDYLPEDGEEVAVYSDGKLLVHSRIADTITELTVETGALGGIPVDEININTFGTTPSPIPAPPSLPPPASPSPPSNAPPSGPPAEGLSGVCASYSSIVPGELLIKSDPSNHIGRHDPRTSGYTVVCAKLCPAQLRYAQFFYSNGEFAGAVAKYGVFSGNGRPRMYGAVGQAPQHDARVIAEKAATIGNGKLYLQMSSATSGAETVCKEFNPTGRNGSL